MPFLMVVLSDIILLVALYFLTFTKLALLYFVLSVPIAFFILRDLPRVTMGGRCEVFGTACINNRFSVISWKKFLISFVILSSISIPLLSVFMLIATVTGLYSNRGNKPQLFFTINL